MKKKLKPSYRTLEGTFFLANSIAAETAACDCMMLVSAMNSCKSIIDHVADGKTNNLTSLSEAGDTQSANLRRKPALTSGMRFTQI